MSLTDFAADRGDAYRSAWPFPEWKTDPAVFSIVHGERDWNLDMAARFPQFATDYARRALKWGATPEQVVQALAAVAA